MKDFFSHVFCFGIVVPVGISKGEKGPEAGKNPHVSAFCVLTKQVRRIIIMSSQYLTNQRRYQGDKSRSLCHPEKAAADLFRWVKAARQIPVSHHSRAPSQNSGRIRAVGKGVWPRTLQRETSETQGGTAERSDAVPPLARAAGLMGAGWRYFFALRAGTAKGFP